MGPIGPLVGEHLALDLVNTRVNLPSLGRLDLLDTVRKLRHWIDCEAERFPASVTTGSATLRRADLDAVLAVREHATTALGHARHGTAPPPHALHGLTSAQRAAPKFTELRWDGTAVVATERREGAIGVRLAAHLAEETADLLADQKVTTIRDCAADFCILWFLPTHPQRRWCSARICGNRARVARHYQRHKQQTPV